MEDKELFDFFKNRSASFDEMPADEVWNKIQMNIGTSKKTSLTISKIALLIVATLAIIVAIAFFANKNKQIIKNERTYLKEVQTKALKDSLTTIITQKDTTLNNIKSITDTLKKRKIVPKKTIISLKKDTVISPPTIVPEMESIEIIKSKTLLDTVSFKPQVKGNRLLFETKKVLSKTEFDTFVQKVLKQTELNFGSLIVVKARGHKPFRHLVKLPDKIKIPHNVIKPANYTTRIILKDSLVFKDSIYFDFKKDE